ncbi:FAD/FMN-containing dehydrogenase [Pseudomonas sp. UM16]|uniref:FAD/FMN-containing dehydrogenase n=1 Tax=Pseudomonas sp. UM16 TaxID=3158962 RepID=UPI00398FC497
MKYAIALLLSLSALLAQAVEVGEHLAPWTLLDQHDQAYSLNDQARTLLVARNMDGAKLVKAALADRPKGYLEARNAVFVADIQRMPALISKLFAIPAMRDYSYRIMLDRDGKVVAQYPGAEDKVLWLQLEQGRVVVQKEYASADELREALAGL